MFFFYKACLQSMLTKVLLLHFSLHEQGSQATRDGFKMAVHMRPGHPACLTT